MKHTTLLLSALGLALAQGLAGAQTSTPNSLPTMGPPPAMAPGVALGAPPGAPPGGMPPPPPAEPVNYIAALTVNGSAVQQDARSGALVQGQATPAGARGLRLRAEKDLVNGLLVQGQGAFALRDSQIELSGRGRSDFDGIAAGALVREHARLTLDKVRITTQGVVSTALTATDQSVLEVNGATLTALGGALPSGYTRRIGPGMMEPPTPLGIVGTARAVLVMGEAHATLRHSTIVADGWGALSTDAAHGATLLAEDCVVKVLRSGYGTYADNGAAVTLRRTVLDVATFGGVIAGQASITLDQVRSHSKGNTVMIHSVMGQPSEVAQLRILGGELESTNAAIVVKSANAEILVEGAKLVAGNGDLILGVVNDDGFATKVNGQAVAGTRATLRNSKLQGNLLQLDTERHLTVALEGTRLTGRIHDAMLSLDATSHWMATADSRVLLAPPFDLARLDAARGVTITAKAMEGVVAPGLHPLPSGGVLRVE